MIPFIVTDTDTVTSFRTALALKDDTMMLLVFEFCKLTRPGVVVDHVNPVVVGGVDTA